MRRTRSRGRRWDVLRKLAKDRDGWRCVKCGRAGRLEVDHIKPVHHNGAMWELDNLQTLCRPCHFAKSAAEQSRPKSAGELAWAELVKQL